MHGPLNVKLNEFHRATYNNCGINVLVQCN